ncbi:MAG: DNA primase [Planctomycetes bacterium]|nr:DNA primase [Planctomycetota bacterium]
MTAYGFRILGDCSNERRLIDWQTAFDAYCKADDRADVNREAYLSAFTFGSAFRRHLESTFSTKDYVGECFAFWLWWDIDREHDIEVATTDARRLCAGLCERFQLDGDELLIFYSGSKGFHVGLPSSMWNPEPSLTFNEVSRRFAETIAERAGITIDTGIYDKVRAFRAPNSRHPKTGLHKRRLTLNELLHLSTAAIKTLAAEPEPFDIPKQPALNSQAGVDWRQATEQVLERSEANKQRHLDLNGSATLNRATVDFIRDGAVKGERTNRLFQAAANLGEFGCSLDLAKALLTEAGLDSGLPPKEVARTIKCGVQHNA